MKKIFGFLIGVLLFANTVVVGAADKFDVLPDLPEPLAAAQASSVSTTDTASNAITTQTIGQEPNLLSVLFSLIFVILLIYATGIIYAKLNKVGMNTLKKQMGETGASKVSVVSTTPLGSNKTLHVVELDGKRMLIGASSGAIQLIKDLGTYPPQTDTEEQEYSKIEIPDIRIPKIEIPKIEFPSGFTKIVSGRSKKNKQESETSNIESKTSESDNDFEISEIYEEGPDGIIDKLFQSDIAPENEAKVAEKLEEHKVDLDEFALYKKYL